MTENRTVWVTPDVALPQALIDAHLAGRLVLFAGAGVSVDEPSGLPLFQALAKTLAAKARVPFVEGIGLDYFLGTFPPQFDIHGHARDEILRPDSRPNGLHKALVRLASSVPPVRIVTTNWDQHFGSAAHGQSIDVGTTWTAPALPLGDDFAGIVHLHGSVARPPADLVMTDADFGRAYMTRAWATRFLLPMFQEFTVLFVGYSHDDPIMRYLSLGLPSRTPRFVFVDEAHAADNKWTRFGIEPIGYPAPRNNHHALLAAIEAWDSRARMGQYEHQARMREIVTGGTSLPPVERDYLVSRLMTRSGAEQFTRSVDALQERGRVEWLFWMEDQSQFRGLFAGVSNGEADGELASWFSSTFIAHPRLSGIALGTVQRLGLTFTSTLFRQASWSTDVLSDLDTHAATRWKALLATSISGHSASEVPDGFGSPYGRELREHRSLLRALLRPRLSLRRRMWDPDAEEGFPSPPDADVQWAVDEAVLTRLVSNLVAEGGASAYETRALLENAVLDAYDLYDAYHGQKDWDPFAFKRSAIEPHSQDQFREPIDALIDGLRFIGEAVGTAAVRDQWWRLERVMFRRLALHALAVDARTSSARKINWILRRDALYQWGLKHELFRVLGSAVADAGTAERQKLLDAILRGPAVVTVDADDLDDRERMLAYEMYNVLEWVTAHAPDWTEAVVELNSLRAARPDFSPREHPDFSSWMSSGSWGPRAPMAIDEFLALLEENRAEALDVLDRPERHPEELHEDWYGSLELAKLAAEKQPQLAQGLWEQIEKQPMADRWGQLRRAIIEGWSGADLKTDLPTYVALVSTVVNEQASARSVSRFVLDQSRKMLDAGLYEPRPELRELASGLWSVQSANYRHSQDTLISMAPLYLNSWPGDLALFWVTEVDRRWRHYRDEWSGLEEVERVSLLAMLKGDPMTLDAVRPALASELFFMYSADRDFVVVNLLPLFRNDATASLMWASYLYHPRFNDRLLADGLLEAAIAQWQRLADFSYPSLLRGQFIAFIAAVLALSAISPDERGRLLDASVLVGDARSPVDFATEMTRFAGLEGVDAQEIWDGWLERHVSARIKGEPRDADAAELAQWADIVPILGSSIPGAVRLFNTVSIPLAVNYSVPKFSDDAIRDYSSALIAHFVKRVRDSTPSWMVDKRIRELVAQLSRLLREDEVRPLLVAPWEAGFLQSEDDD